MEGLDYDLGVYAFAVDLAFEAFDLAISGQAKGEFESLVRDRGFPGNIGFLSGSYNQTII